MATASLTAELRDETGKGAARKLRAAGRVPAVVYGHHRQPQSLTLDARDLGRVLDRVSASSVFELAVGGTTVRALIREIQRHPVKRTLVHVDFQELVAGERVTVRVPLVFVGTADGVRNQGGLLEEVTRELEISADPANIPDHIDVDVSALTIGHPLHVRDVALPQGVTVLTDAGATVVQVSAPRLEDEGASSGAAPSGEPEVLRAAKKDAD
jgi:large subunit ribosomal protein L25